MYGTNEVSSTPTFNDDDWEAIFGKEDELDNVKELNQSDFQRTVCSSTNSVVAVDNSETTFVHKTQDIVHPEKQAQSTLSSMVVMDLCMKREQKLRAEGNIIEANALSTVGFSVMNLMAKVMELLQSNECIHVGSLMLEAVKASMNKGSNEWESLILCTTSIHALIDEVRMKNEDLDDNKQLKVKDETEKNLDKKELATKLANERKKRKLEAALARKQEEANEMRKRRRAMQRTESHSVFSPPITYKAKNYMETSDDDKNTNKNTILIMAANKYKIRKEERQRQTERKSQISQERKCLPQSNVSVISNLLDDKNFTGPISAEALMEECEESDSSNSITLPSFPVQEAANYNCLQQSHSLLSSRGEPTTCHTSDHIRNALPVTGEGNNPKLTNNIPNQSATSPYSSIAVKNSNSSEKFQPSMSMNSTITTNPIRAKRVTQSAQKYNNLNFVKIRKVGAKLNKNTSEKLQPEKKNVLFVAEDEYSIVEVSNDPNSTTDAVDIIAFRDYRKKYPRGSAVMPEEEKRKKMEKLPPREYDFFLSSAIPRQVGSINARSFCESCEFTRGNIRNWLIVGSRFDRLNENVFDVKKSGCPKTHLSRANYPPIHFRILSDALTHLSTDVAGLKIFLAVGEDWIVKSSMILEEFTSFIRKFAHILHELYVRQYTLQCTKKTEFTDDLEKFKSDYAYVEMPTIILLTIPARNDSDAEMKCNFYNGAIKELVQNWDATCRSPYYHNATKQCIELKLIDWRQICVSENARSNDSMITILMKHLMEEWGICMTPTNRS
ncbi:hypothetical protein LOAG_07968 [Loa loa]|uniref:C2H2-type domain-containing protein n=1 Tax=Loa loa TaxID=7209 RepID=A0A1I7VA73_LOALO|nr:hypothetical protein LOAG_07968 [Loa loa]EFO20520.2 hypothetical protein LOAG_07968 [Loa loa]